MTGPRGHRGRNGEYRLRRIEMLGPMGAGKSTLHGKLIRAAQAALAPFTVCSGEVEKWRIWSAHVRRRNRLLGRIAPILGRVRGLRRALIEERILGPAWVALEARWEQFSPVVHHVLKESGRAEMGSCRNLERLDWFIRDLADVALLEAHGSCDLLLQDESLLQRGVGFALDAPESRDSMRRYLSAIPLPDLVIHVTAPPRALEERIVERGRRVDQHAPRVKRACRLATEAGEVLRANGIPVVDVDGWDGTDVAVKACLDRMRRTFPDRA